MFMRCMLAFGVFFSVCLHSMDNKRTYEEAFGDDFKMSLEKWEDNYLEKIEKSSDMVDLSEKKNNSNDLSDLDFDKILENIMTKNIADEEFEELLEEFDDDSFNTSDFALNESIKKKSLDIDLKCNIFEEKAEKCEYCTKEYTNKAIHSIFYCAEKRYSYAKFFDTYEVDSRQVYQCKGCKEVPMNVFSHSQTCAFLPMTYLSYCSRCDHIFSSYAIYLRHLKTLERCKSKEMLIDCPIEGCSFCAQYMGSMAEHFRDKHSEKDVLCAFKNKSERWFKGVGRIKKKKKVVKKDKKVVISKSELSLGKNIFKEAEGECGGDCKVKYVCLSLHKMFWCKNPYKSLDFFIEKTENRQCNKCFSYFQKTNGHEHVFVCPAIPLLYIQCCLICKYIFRSRKHFSLHKKRCKNAKSTCCIESCGFEDNGKKKMKDHYKNEHNEQEVLKALQDLTLYAHKTNK